MTTTPTTTKPKQDHHLGWCCVDCLFLLANGDTPEYMDETETAAWLAEIDRICQGTEVTLGMMAGEHDEDCANIDWTVDPPKWEGSTDCSCEQQEFSWSRCDTCGSRLGGAREAVTFWYPAEDVG